MSEQYYSLIEEITKYECSDNSLTSVALLLEEKPIFATFTPFVQDSPKKIRYLNKDDTINIIKHALDNNMKIIIKVSEDEEIEVEHGELSNILNELITRANKVIKERDRK